MLLSRKIQQTLAGQMSKRIRRDPRTFTKSAGWNLKRLERWIVNNVGLVFLVSLVLFLLPSPYFLVPTLSSPILPYPVTPTLYPVSIQSPCILRRVRALDYLLLTRLHRLFWLFRSSRARPAWN